MLEELSFSAPIYANLIDGEGEGCLLRCFRPVGAYSV